MLETTAVPRSNRSDVDDYPRFLEHTGAVVVQVDGVWWYEYSGFLIPAYLPHLCPPIQTQTASEVLSRTGASFIRWDSDYNTSAETEWWYVLKTGPWSIADVKEKKKRWMIRKGVGAFTFRKLLEQEVLTLCPEVATRATERYKGKATVESADDFRIRLKASAEVSGVLEYLGCFKDGNLASWCESVRQGDAIWLTNIRHAPEHLGEYSAYALMNGILEYYLNERGMRYVLDGSRSIHHRTEFQDHLIRVFGFEKVHSRLNLLYSRRFKAALALAFPFRGLVWRAQEKIENSLLDNIGAVLSQERIRRNCVQG